MNDRTLCLTPISPRFFMSALVILAILFGIAETLFRQASIQALLSAPSLNSRHRQLEVQWHRLETLVGSGDQVPCIVLGNSMVLRGFDPSNFSKGFQSQSGAPIACFNFGVDGLTAISAGVLAEILNARYHPDILIYGTSPRDYVGTAEIDSNTVVLEMKWIQYLTGSFNMEGWVIEHSYLYRYRHHITDIMHLYFRYALPLQEVSPLNRYGYDSDDTVAVNIEQTPDPNLDDYLIQSYYNLMRGYTMQTPNLVGLDKILSQSGVTVIVVEMPVPDTFYAFFSDHGQGYQTFQMTIREVTSEYNVELVETNPVDIIPHDGWVDYTHLNTEGAAVFSEWLGRQIAQFIKHP